MKIGSNLVGNYSINPVQHKPVPQKSEELSSEEKNFFINRYPDKKEEISDYHFYQRSGRMSGVSVGQLFDKRG